MGVATTWSTAEVISAREVVDPHIMDQTGLACGIILGEPSMATETEPNRVTFKTFPLLITVLFLVLLAGLSACSTSPRPPTSPASQDAGAEQAFASGDYEQAARIWQQEALAAEAGLAGSYRVRAADAWLLDNKPGPATDLLKWISRDDLDNWDRSMLDLVLADLALRQERPDEAELHLKNAQPFLPRSSRNRYAGLVDRAQESLSRPLSRDISRAAMLSDSLQSYDPLAALNLIESLENVSSGELAVRADNPRAERQLTGWLDLALVIRQNLVVADHVTQAVAAWKTRHPYHMLSESDALDIWLRYRQQFLPPRKVAVLLPETGRLSAPSAAIRDGLMSAYLDNPGAAEIYFFATDDEPDSAIAAYFSAMDAGADWIIGPLQKDHIEAILNLAGLATPVLALNELPGVFSAPAGLQDRIFGMSLSQEKEAISVARQAVDSEYQRAVVLAPESSWGGRMAEAFQSEFLHEDREIITAARFLESDNDHSPVIERILKIDESKARKKRLENTLQMTLEFEAVRRNDIDLIFLAANSSQARLIRPQLRFHDAGDIPVYSTGRVYTGRPDPAHNQDLNGIRFPITPWQLQHVEAADMPNLESIRDGSLAAFFAVGQDAWGLLPWLELMRKDPDFSVHGQSGIYRAGNHENLQRDPAWAVFSRGRPAPLTPPLKTGLQSYTAE
jgi:outer membrane PBP1 activator LpoA protein